jgi:hypothetical protein
MSAIAAGTTRAMAFRSIKLCGPHDLAYSRGILTPQRSLGLPNQLSRVRGVAPNNSSEPKPLRGSA